MDGKGLKVRLELTIKIRQYFASSDIVGTALDLTNNGSDTGQDIYHTHSSMPAQMFNGHKCVNMCEVLTPFVHIQANL